MTRRVKTSFVSAVSLEDDHFFGTALREELADEGPMSLFFLDPVSKRFAYLNLILLCDDLIKDPLQKS